MQRNIITSVFVSFTAILFYSSCAKVDTTTLGNGLIPAVDNITTFDTVLDVITDNKLFNDTSRMLYGEPHALGIIENDAEFGKTTAAIYSSFTPTVFGSYPFTNRDEVVVDSVILSLAYSGTYGDSTNTVQQFEVREINPISSFTDSNYFLNTPAFPVRPDVLGMATVNFSSLKDSVFYKDGNDTIRTAGELRIPLDTAFARRFINYDTTDAYRNDTMFYAHFKGLEIKANEGSPVKSGLAYFVLEDNSRTKITFYCRVQNNGVTDTIAPTFVYTSGPHANLVSRTPANGYLANVTNSTDNDEKLYLQTSPGSYATIKIPGLENLSNRVIHRAELTIEKYPSDQNFYAAPGSLFIDALNAAGDSSFTIRNDFVLNNSTIGYDQNTLGGIFSNDKYTFLLTRYIQSIVTKKFPNYTLRVYAPYTTLPFYMEPNTNQISGKVGLQVNVPVAAGRVVVYGGGSTDAKKMRLRIIYSKI